MRDGRPQIHLLDIGGVFELELVNVERVGEVMLLELLLDEGEGAHGILDESTSLNNSLSLFNHLIIIYF